MLLPPLAGQSRGKGRRWRRGGKRRKEKGEGEGGNEEAEEGGKGVETGRQKEGGRRG